MDRMTKEAIRYLGYGRNAVDEQTLAFDQRLFCESEICSKSQIHLPYF